MLAQRARTEQEKQEAVQQEIDAFDQVSAEMIRELGKPASTAGRPIAGVAKKMQDEISNERTLEIRREQAENLWRGLWSAQTILRLVTEEARESAAKGTLQLAERAHNYRQRVDLQRAPEVPRSTRSGFLAGREAASHRA